MSPRRSRRSPMRWSLSRADLTVYVTQQLATFASPRSRITTAQVGRYMPETLERVERCFTQIRRKYYFDGTRAIFDHHHGDHWATFLYFLSNTIHRQGKSEDLAASVFLLNKALHGADLFYGVTLPEVFLLIHPVGTVLGNATYGNYLVAYQNCGVGAVEDGTYPVFEGETVLFARSAVLGRCTVGRNVIIGANSFIINTDVPANHVVVGSYPNHRMLPNARPIIERMFR